MSDAPTFPIIWDSGASTALTFAKSDFVVSFHQLTSPVSLSGVAQQVTIEGERKVRWSILDQHGSLRTLTVPALYITKFSVQQLSISHLLQEYQGESIQMSHKGLEMSGIPGDSAR